MSSESSLCRLEEDIQKIERFEGKNISELVGIEERILSNRNQLENGRHTKKITKILALHENRMEFSKIRDPSGCHIGGPAESLMSYCKKKGHWI